MAKETIDRRGAIGGMMGCLMSPFIPALRVPKKLEPAKQSFFVEHYDPDYGYMASLSRGGRTKAYRLGSVAEFILSRLYSEGEITPNTNEYNLLCFIWARHNHETTDII